MLISDDYTIVIFLTFIDGEWPGKNYHILRLSRLVRRDGTNRSLGVRRQLSLHTLQEAKYVESWPSTTSAWAGWSRFDIAVDRYAGVHSLLCGPAEHWSLLPATRLASRIILIEQNIKKRTGPALCVLCAYTGLHYVAFRPTLAHWRFSHSRRS